MFSFVLAQSSEGLLPNRIGKSRLLQTKGPSSSLVQEGSSAPVAQEQAEYAGEAGEKIHVEIVRFKHDGEAYESLTLASALARAQKPEIELRRDVGTASFSSENQITFFKGVYLVRITSSKPAEGSRGLNTLAQTLSDTLDKGEGDIPVLIKHLPNPDEAQKSAVYLSTFNTLDALPLQQPVLSAVESVGNADAALATYGPSKLLVVEFNTPQLAAENDRKIIARIQELWKLGQPAPAAYRRVGNYCVFVFGAPDEQTAKQLIDQVKYEQVVQWLGDNPNILAAAERHYINTTLGVLIAVFKASGFTFIACFALGGLFGALLFSYRRAQQKRFTAFSDAGGMMRLNLDQMTSDLPETRR